MTKFAIKGLPFGADPRFVHEKPDGASNKLAVLTGLVAILEEEGDWRKVKHFEDVSKATENATGYVLAAHIGAPVEMPAEPKRKLRDFCRNCAVTAQELRQGGAETLSSPYLVALAFIEHGITPPAVPGAAEQVDFSKPVGRAAGRGAYGLTAEHWGVYLDGKGSSLNQGAFDFYNSLSHPRAAAYFAIRDWRAFVKKSGLTLKIRNYRPGALICSFVTLSASLLRMKQRTQNASAAT